MADAITPLPEAKAFGEDERSVLLGRHADLLREAIDGATGD